MRFRTFVDGIVVCVTPLAITTSHISPHLCTFRPGQLLPRLCRSSHSSQLDHSRPWQGVDDNSASSRTLRKAVLCIDLLVSAMTVRLRRRRHAPLLRCLFLLSSVRAASSP